MCQSFLGGVLALKRANVVLTFLCSKKSRVYCLKRRDRAGSFRSQHSAQDRFTHGCTPSLLVIVTSYQLIIIIITKFYKAHISTKVLRALSQRKTKIQKFQLFVLGLCFESVGWSQDLKRNNIYQITGHFKQLMYSLLRLQG